MKFKLLLILTLALFIVNLTAFATLAYHKWLRIKEDNYEITTCQPISLMNRHLCLNDRQINVLRELRSQFDEDVQELQTQLDHKQLELISLLKEEDPSQEKIDPLLTQIASLQIQLQKKSIMFMIEEKKTLTPEQRKTFFDLAVNYCCPQKMGHNCGNKKMNIPEHGYCLSKSNTPEGGNLSKTEDNAN